jgi:hypothetical protein
MKNLHSADKAERDAFHSLWQLNIRPRNHFRKEPMDLILSQSIVFKWLDGLS